MINNHSRSNISVKFMGWFYDFVVPFFYGLNHIREQFMMRTEYDLHRRVASYIRNCYPYVVITACCGRIKTHLQNVLCLIERYI